MYIFKKIYYKITLKKSINIIIKKLYKNILLYLYLALILNK